MFKFGFGGGLFGILVLILFIWALVDIVRARREGTWKLLWIVICLILPLVGPVVYYLLGRSSAPPRMRNLPRA